MSPTATDVRVLYGPGAPPVPPNDPDALAFLAAARGKTAADEGERVCGSSTGKSGIAWSLSISAGLPRGDRGVARYARKARVLRGEACRS